MPRLGRLAAGLTSLLVGCAAGSAPAPVAAPTRAKPLVLDSAPSAEEVGEPGWLVSGGASEAYAVRRDVVEDRAAWLLEPARDTYGGYGTWMRHVDPGSYRGRRVRITATVRTQRATKRVDFWARAQASDSPSDGRGLGGDWRKLPADSTWRNESIVLEVPPETAWLEYGVGVAGPGKVWLEKTTIEIVGADVSLTAQSRAPDERPVTAHWGLSGDDVPEYEGILDKSIKHAGQASGSVRARVAQPKGFATLAQLFTGTYLGKRVRLSAFIRAEDVKGWAGLWMRVDKPGRMGSSAFDNMEDRPIKGTRDWTRYEVVLDVAPDAADVAFGVLLHGSGQVWIDDVAFDVVDTSVATTGTRSRPQGALNLDFEQ